MRRQRRHSGIFVAMLVSGLFCAVTAQAERSALILCGAGDKAEYQKQFRDWGTRLDHALVHVLGFSESSVTLLMEPLDTPMPPRAQKIQLDAIRDAFGEVAKRNGPNDDFFLFLIGHGSFQNNVSKLIIPGPDLSAENLGKLLDTVPAQRQVIIDSTSSSAGFINALSGKGRIICTATKSAEERNATQFMEYFLQAIEEGSADQDRDERISVLEACQQAAVLTQAAYTGEGVIATEHAILDDNGDGLGSRLPIGGNEGEASARPASGGDAHIDGAIAAKVYLRDFAFPPAAPPELIKRYRDALAAIEALKSKKTTMDSEAYYGQLEKLFIKAAKINRDIRAFAAPAPKSGKGTAAADTGTGQ